MRSLIVAAIAMLMVPTAWAQQNIAYIDTDYILERTPEYAAVQQQVDRLAEEWANEIEEGEQDIEERFREYQARELLYTNEERQRRREDIMRAEDELERLRMKYFGPEGDLFVQQEQLMRPLQERILAAVEQVATRDGYDYVFDKSGDFLFMYARPQYDLSDDVLRELGIDVEENRNARR